MLTGKKLITPRGGGRGKSSKPFQKETSPIYIKKKKEWGWDKIFIYATNFQDVIQHRNKRYQFQLQTGWSKLLPH